MAERIDNRLLFQILKGLQTRVTMLEAILGEIRDGFVSIRVPRSVQGEAGVLQRRVGELERRLEPSSAACRTPSRAAHRDQRADRLPYQQIDRA